MEYNINEETLIDNDPQLVKEFDFLIKHPDILQSCLNLKEFILPYDTISYAIAENCWESVDLILNKREFKPTELTIDDVFYLIDESEHKYLLNIMNGKKDILYRWFIKNKNFEMIKLLYENNIEYTKINLIDELKKLICEHNIHSREIWEEPDVQMNVYIRLVMN